MPKTANPRLNNPFIALRHKNFAYYWLGMCISLIGTWMQNTAQPWLAYKLTDSPLLLSLVGVVQFAPSLFLSLHAGVLVDKFSKKTLLLCTQTASLIITLMLTILSWSGHIAYWHILITSLALGLVNTLDMPTRQSFVIELVGRDDLMNAIALNSSVFNLARIIGPAVAGIVMAYAGISACFFINSISFAAVIISLVFIKPLVVRSVKKEEDIFYSITQGFKYIYRTPSLLNTLLIMGIVATFAMNFSVLIPVFSKTVLHQGETGFSLLMSSMGVGSLIGAMSVATMSSSGPREFNLKIVPLILGIVLFMISFTRIYAITALLLAAAGYLFTSFSSTANSTMQLNTNNEFRGRVMSIYSLVFSGTTPIGNLYAGYISNHFGASIGFAACGGIILGLCLILYIYRKKNPG